MQSNIFKFFIGLCAIHIVLLLVGTVIDNTHETSIVKKEVKFHAQQSEIDTIYFGNSRVKSAIGKSNTAHSFNYALGNEFYWSYYYRLKKLVQNDSSSLSVVILPAETGAFIHNTIKMTQSLPRFWLQYVDYQEMAFLTGDYVKYYSLKLTSTWFPYIEIINKNINWFSQPKKFKKRNRHGAQSRLVYSSLSTAGKDSLDDLKLKKITRDNPRFDLGVWYFKKTVELCRQNNIEMIFVKYPMTANFRAKLKKIEQQNGLEDTNAIFDSLNLNILDFETCFDHRHDLFSDSDHLNEQGQEEFAKILNRAIRSK